MRMSYSSDILYSVGQKTNVYDPDICLQALAQTCEYTFSPFGLRQGRAYQQHPFFLTPAQGFESNIYFHLVSLLKKSRSLTPWYLGENCHFSGLKHNLTKWGLKNLNIFIFFLKKEPFIQDQVVAMPCLPAAVFSKGWGDSQSTLEILIHLFLNALN